MDYCARESTAVTDDICCEREMSIGDLIAEIRKELSETISCLSQMKVNLDGDPFNERKVDEPKCLMDEIKLIEHMAVDCIGLSHTIYDKLYRR